MKGLETDHNQTLPKLGQFIRYKWRSLVLVGVISTLSIPIFLPVTTVRGLVVTTSITNINSVSVDSNRIAGWMTTGTVFVYDVASSTSVTFSPPLSIGVDPQLSGKRIVMMSASTLFSSPNLYYCDLPPTAVLTPCSGWNLLVSGLPTLGSVGGAFSLASAGFPVYSGDLVAWPIANGLSYFRFSSGATTTMSFTTQPSQLSTDGQRIAFVLGGALSYIDTSSCVGPCTPATVSTGLPASSQNGTAVYHYAIAFDEPTTPVRVRYYDIRTGTANPAGTGPLGAIVFGGIGTPGIWEDRIAFTVKESDLGFDCNSDGTISSTQGCLRYWNIRNPNVLLLPEAAPPIPSLSSSPPVAIGDHLIAFQSPTGSLQYVKVPLQGDIDLDGRVDILDASALAICFDAVLKGMTC